MPSTYDPLLRLELQATGENATTWGVKTNTNLDLIAESIAGAVTLNVAGSGDYTLSTANGAEDEARQAILILTGALTGNRNIIVPASPKNYTVINNTTGAFTVTLKQAAGTGLTIPTTGPTITVCTSTTCVDSIGATPYTKSFLAATSVAPAASALGLANTATTSASPTGIALITAVDTSAGRAAINAIGPGSIVTSGLTMTTNRLLGRTTAASGAVEEISIGAGLTLSGGSLSNTASLPKIQTQAFSSSGTFTVPAGITRVKVVVVGGGGGGGAGQTIGGTEPVSGGTGGTGGTAAAYLDVTPAQSISVTVGAGGAGSNSGAGSAGGSSSFGSLLSASGGNGGAAASGGPGANGANGAPTGGNVWGPSAPFITGSNPATGTAAVAATITGNSTVVGLGGTGELGDTGNNARGGVGGAVFVEWIG